MLLLLSLMLLCAGVTAEFQCTIVPGTLKQIDAGDHKVYGVSEKDEVFQWLDNKWTEVPGKLIHVTVGPSGVWGVSEGYVVYRLQDNEWKPVTGHLKQVDAGGNKFLAGVDAKGKIFCLRQSCTVLGSTEVTFDSLDGELKYYSCGPWGCWGVSKADDVYYRQSVRPQACKGSSWQQVEGKLSMVEVGSEGSVYGVNSEGQVYKREGVSESSRTGTSWTQLDLCSTFKHVSYDNGTLWLINKGAEIYKCTESVYQAPNPYREQRYRG